MIANVPAEIAVVGAALLGNPVGLLELNDDDFTDPRTKSLALVLRDMIRSGRTPDSIQAINELERRGLMRAGLDRNFIISLGSKENTPLVAAADYYAEAVRTTTRIRITANEAQRLAKAAAHESAADDLAEIIARHTEALNSIPPMLDAAAPDAPATIADLFKMEITHDWLIPGLIERGERVVIVASEGGGKSVLNTQWAVALAGGLHPFTGQPSGQPKRVLLVDTENGLFQTQRRYEWVGRRFPNAAAGWATRIQHHIHTEGLDLPGKDRAWFLKVAADCSPDLIIVGPAYKIMRGDPQRDNDVMALLNVLDEVRKKHNAALLIETHAGHGKDTGGTRIIRPYGSSVWLRWPEIGIGLTRGPGDAGGKYVNEFQVNHWRGQREARDWPELIERGTERQLPWSPVGSDFYTTAARKAIS